MIKKLAVLAVVLVVVAGGLLWWLNRDDPPAELSADGESASQDTGEVPESLDGTWTVEAGGDTTAGFRIVESFAGGVADHTAVGRSEEVAGSLTIDGTSVSEGSFLVDLTEIEFTDDAPINVANRANAMKTKGLETNDFPEASFALTQPIDFGEAPAEGTLVEAEATGDLTIHGVTKRVTFPVEAKLDGATIRVATVDPVPVVLADYDIDKPTGGPIASIEDEGSFEFLIVLTQG